MIFEGFPGRPQAEGTHPDGRKWYVPWALYLLTTDCRKQGTRLEDRGYKNQSIQDTGYKNQMIQNFRVRCKIFLAASWPLRVGQADI